MKIKQDLLRIRTSPFDHKGERIEPEEQPVQRVLQTDAPVTMQGSSQVQGTIPSEIVHNTTAGEAANIARRPCIYCKHWDRAAWRKLFAYWNDPSSPMEERRNLNGIRALLLETQNAQVVDKSPGQDGEIDVEHALGLLGICRPLTELVGGPQITYPTAACPDQVCTQTQPYGFFEPKDKQADRQGSEAFDRIMNVARGKK